MVNYIEGVIESKVGNNSSEQFGYPLKLYSSHPKILYYIQLKVSIFKSAGTRKFGFKISHRSTCVSWDKYCTHWCTFNFVIKLIIEFHIIVL